MRSRLLVLLIAIAPIFWFAPSTSSVAEPFEVRFWPAGSVYRVTLSDDEHLYDCVIHNVAIVNRTPAPILLQRIEYQSKLRQQYGPRGSDGNFVMIDHGNGECSVMVHLKKNSIRVKRGDRVKRGQMVAQVGQSGLSTEPHLHFEVVTDPDPFKQRGVPVYFVGLEDADGPKFLHSGDLVTRGSN